MRVHDLFLKTWDLAGFLQNGSEIAQDPLVRLILTSDGTITRILRALHQNPIRLEVKAQMNTSLEPEITQYLEVNRPWRAIARKIWLKKDQQPLLYASTILAFSRENSCLFEEIHQRDKPLGFLLEEFQLPSLKDKLIIGRMIHPDISRSLGLAHATELWARHYRLTIQSRSPRAEHAALFTLQVPPDSLLSESSHSPTSKRRGPLAPVVRGDLPSEQGECEGEAPSGSASGGGDASPYNGTRASVLEIFSPAAFGVQTDTPGFARGYLLSEQREREGEAPSGFAGGGGDASPSK